MVSVQEYRQSPLDIFQLLLEDLRNDENKTNLLYWIMVQGRINGRIGKEPFFDIEWSDEVQALKLTWKGAEVDANNLFLLLNLLVATGGEVSEIEEEIIQQALL